MGGATDAFVIKYTNDGTFEWIESFNTSLHESISGLDVDSDGNIHVAGRVSFDLSEPRGSGKNWYGQELGNRYYAAFGASINKNGEIIAVNAYHPHYNTGGLDIASTSNGYLVSTYIAGPPAPSNPVNYSFVGNDNQVDWTKDSVIPAYLASVESFVDSSGFAIVTGSDQVSIVDQSGDLLQTFSTPDNGTIHDLAVKDDKLYLLSRSGSISDLDVSVFDKNGVQIGDSLPIQNSSRFVDGYPFKYDLEILSNGKYFVGGITEGTGSSDDLGVSYREYILVDPNPKPIIVRGNSLYTIVDGPSWTEAEANSVKLGGHLVTVSSNEEDNFVDALLNDYFYALDKINDVDQV